MDNAKCSPLQTVAHVRSWLKAHPEAKVGPSGDWELPRKPTAADTIAALRDSVRDCLSAHIGSPLTAHDADELAALVARDVAEHFVVELAADDEQFAAGGGR